MCVGVCMEGGGVWVCVWREDMCGCMCGGKRGVCTFVCAEEGGIRSSESCCKSSPGLAHGGLC